MKKKESINVNQILLELIVKMYVIFMLLIFPLYYRNNYIDIMRAKRDIYAAGTMGLLLFVLVLGIGYLKEKQQLKVKQKCENKMLYALAVLFVLVCVTGGFFSGHVEDAFLGVTGRYLGVGIFVSGVVVMFIIARFLKWDTVLNWCFIIGATLVFFLQICNQWKIDILGMNENLILHQHGYFISTVGSLNFNATFNCMVIGMGMVFFYLCKNKSSSIVYGCFLLLGFAAAFSCRSDSVFIGIGMAFFVLAGYVLYRKQCMEKVWVMGGLFFVASCLFKLFYEVFESHAYVIDGAGLMLLDWRVLIGEGILLVIFGIGIKLVMKRERLAKWLWKIYFWGSIGCVCLLVLSILIVNTGIVEESGILSALHINDSWGHDRGYIWRRTLVLFGEYPLWQKIIGCGLNCYSYVLDEAYGAEMMSLLSAKFIDAHSEYFQMLASTGIAGFIGYFGMLLTILKKSVKQVVENETALLGIVGVTVYLAQGIVNGPQVTTIPLLFVEMGICMSVLRKNQ